MGCRGVRRLGGAKLVHAGMGVGVTEAHAMGVRGRLVGMPGGVVAEGVAVGVPGEVVAEGVAMGVAGGVVAEGVAVGLAGAVEAVGVVGIVVEVGIVDVTVAVEVDESSGFANNVGVVLGVGVVVHTTKPLPQPHNGIDCGQPSASVKITSELRPGSACPGNACPAIAQITMAVISADADHLMTLVRAGSAFVERSKAASCAALRLAVSVARLPHRSLTSQQQSTSLSLAGRSLRHFQSPSRQEMDQFPEYFSGGRPPLNRTTPSPRSSRRSPPARSRPAPRISATRCRRPGSAGLCPSRCPGR